ncbi:MAG TPA: hypothetical protein VHB47_18240, partial [Thermoanaerobaculia bacterium]|nr:hypothetical protein [Thermoanaerobaculia bacterium]
MPPPARPATARGTPAAPAALATLAMLLLGGGLLGPAPASARAAAARPHRPRHRAAAAAAAASRPAAPVGVPAAGATPLQEAVGLEVGRAVRATTSMGVNVVEVGSGETAYAYDADDARTIASNTKLFTTAAA